jgi:hypothetical protein
MDLTSERILQISTGEISRFRVFAHISREELPSAIGMLVLLWEWVAGLEPGVSDPSGQLTSDDERILPAIMELRMDASDIAAALVFSGFATRDGQVLTVDLKNRIAFDPFGEA